MSSILKALKRLEEERAGRSASSSTGSGGQFVAPLRAAQPLMLLIFGVGAGLLLAGGLYVLLGGRPSVQTSAPPVPQEEKTVSAAVQTVPLVVLPVDAGVSAAAPEKVAPRPKPPAVARQDRPVTVAATSPAAAISVAPAGVLESQPVPLAHVQVKRRDIPPPGEQWSAPQLVVSEILTTAAGGRMAIVNDMPVMVGTMLDGVMVDEIREDRVVFVAEGRSVSVPLDQRRPAVDRQ